MTYKQTRFCENLNISQFETVGEYNIPVLAPCDFEPVGFIGFNGARSAKDKHNKGVHFFVDDYQFERLWRMPREYLGLIGEFHTVMTPDFSLYMDYPKAMQIYNHYRKQWLGALWQYIGCRVVPTVSWSDRDSFTWCFDGIPAGATVAVSSVGTQRTKETKGLFLDGWFAMLERLNPARVLFYGTVPEECNGVDVVHIKPFHEKFMEVR